MHPASTLIPTFAALAAAAPSNILEARQASCPLFPWFLTPWTGPGCTGTAGSSQTSGGAIFPPPSKGCTQLSSPVGTIYDSVAVNPDACSGDTYTIYLYSDPYCESAPVPVTQNQCVDGIHGFQSFAAYPVIG